jgi:site-specific DNA-cytosine methylase
MDEGGDDSALDVLLRTLAEKGYDTQAFKVNANDYGMPQSRTRLFFMGMRRPGRALTIRDYDLFFKHVGRFLEIFFHLGRALAPIAYIGGP